jgi:hypothetical protein
MTIAAFDQAPQATAVVRHRPAATRSQRGFRTILAIHRGQVYVPDRRLAHAGWMVALTDESGIRSEVGRRA